MAEKTYTYIPAELKSASVGGVVVSAEGVYDYLLNKNQQEINQNQKEMNQNTIQWDPDEENFFRIDKQGNKVIINGDLTKVVVNYLKEDTELGDEFTEFIVTNIKDGDLLGDTYVSGDEFNEYKTEITQTINGAGKVDDVEINGNSQLNENTKKVNLAVEGTYNSSSNKLASMDAVKDIPNNETFINNLKNNTAFNQYITNKVNSESSGGTLTDVQILGSEGNPSESLVPQDETTAILITAGTYDALQNKVTTESAAEDIAVNIPNNADFITNLKNNSTFTTYIRNQASDAAGGGQENVIETVKVNNTALTVTNKAVNVTVPTEINDLSDGSSLKTSVNNLSSDLDTLTSRIDGIVAGGGEPNLINSIKVNNEVVEPVNKTVSLTIPTTNSIQTDIFNTFNNSTSQNPINITNLSSTNATINNLTTTTHARTVYEVTASNSSINIDATNGDIQIITLGTSSNPIATVSGIDISNAKVGQNITIILKTAVQGSANIQVVNNDFYIWNNKDNEQSSGVVTLTAPQDGYCEISFLCFAKNVTINNTTKDRFYVRGV